MEPVPRKTLVEAFQRDGFVNAGPVLTPAEVSALATELERHVDAAFRGTPTGVEPAFLAQDLSFDPSRTIHQLTYLWEVSPPFLALASHPVVVELAAALAGAPDLQVWADQVQYKPPVTGGAATWHQDAPYWAPVQPATLLTAWIALDDATVENGCMWMVPGSHLWGEQNAALLSLHGVRKGENFGSVPALPLPEGSAPWRDAVPCPVKAGEVHFHHCLTWHGSPDNESALPRRAFAIHYMPTGVLFTGHTAHPLAPRIRVPKGAPMMDDPERFPVVFRAGRVAGA